MSIYRTYASPLGGMYMVSDGDSLTELFFEDVRPLPASACGNAAVFDETVRWLDMYFSGTAPDFMPKLNAEGTVFRKLVWDMLLTVPYGQTVTYGELAGRFYRPMSAQAVGSAVGHNPICLIIPCHRVVGADGSLTGYSGGIDRKFALLHHEQGLI
ncbi:MAG: methylated-DNA--[Oscillospiraceae bacterium]|nr:methylated-DNA--[protein]-cysteine S-methyltransferase [Oscillospiraceae bacterium]MBQ8978929.1 methylated-DNA--[protein]-cysteine S-methyltransferase [Oscillospiraceae bacterium]